MSDPVTAVMVVGALFSINTIGQESGCGPGCAQLPGSAAHYPHTPCPAAVYPAAAPLQGGGGHGGAYQYYGGHAPTPAYMSGTRFYGYSVGYGNAPAGFTSQYAGASKYYHD